MSGSHGSAENADTGAACGMVEVVAELAVVVANGELGPDAERRGLPHLLRRPLGSRVSGNSNMHNLLRLMSTMKNAKIGRNQTSYACRKSHAQTV